MSLDGICTHQPLHEKLVHNTGVKKSSDLLVHSLRALQSNTNTVYILNLKTDKQRNVPECFAWVNMINNAMIDKVFYE